MNSVCLSIGVQATLMLVSKMSSLAFALLYASLNNLCFSSIYIMDYVSECSYKHLHLWWIFYLIQTTLCSSINVFEILNYKYTFEWVPDLVPFTGSSSMRWKGNHLTSGSSFPSLIILFFSGFLISIPRSSNNFTSFLDT